MTLEPTPRPDATPEPAPASGPSDAPEPGPAVWSADGILPPPEPPDATHPAPDATVLPLEPAGVPAPGAPPSAGADAAGAPSAGDLAAGPAGVPAAALAPMHAPPAAAEVPPTPAPAPTGPPVPTAPAASARRETGGLRLVVAAATLSAVLASGGTAALLLASRPDAAPAATAPATAAASAAPATTVVTRVDGADAVAAVAAAAEPSVVTISSATSRFGDTGGSGIIVSADGLILTTAIVAPSDTTYDILLADQHQTTARVVASDPAHGLVVLQANTTGLAPARLAASGELVVGQVVVAVGSPLGQFTDTVTSGIVSGLDRTIDLRDPSSGVRVALEGLIQTDAAINAGSSGGPLLDAGGTVVGVIATSASDGQGIGFAIPIADALDLIARAEA